MSEYEDPLAPSKGLLNACCVVIPFYLLGLCAILVILLKVMK